jgi:Glycosyl hydrolase family 26
MTEGSMWNHAGGVGSLILRLSLGLPLALVLVACRVAPPPPGHLYHGVAPIGVNSEEGAITPSELSSYEQQVGKTAAWVYFSNDWFQGRGFPLQTATWIRDTGAVPFIRLMLRSSHEQNVSEPVFTLDRIIRGDFDGDLRSWARAARDFASPLLVEYGTEVNGRWFSWNGLWNGGGSSSGYGDPTLADGPERFRDSYRHIVRVMREEGASNVTWVFHVNNRDIPDEPWNRMEQYYPGDEWVDWIGVSVYGAQTPLDDEWPEFREVMDGAYPRLASLSASKPIVLLEFAVTTGHKDVDQAAWAEQALRDLVSLRWPRVIGFSWWNEAWQNDDNPAHDTNMRVQDSAALAGVFRGLVGMQDNVLGRVLLAN